jgi:hypothetical protein
MMQWLTAVAKWSVSDRLLLIYDVVTAIAALVAILALNQIRVQAKVMSEQLEQMKASGKQTDDLIAVARDQATALGIAAKAAQESADAALLNAQAIINSERPWLFVKLTISSENIFPIPGSQHALPSYFTFDLENSGRTPAELIYSYSNFSICPSREVDDVKIAERDLGKEHLHKEILAPNEAVRINKFTFAGQGAALMDQELMSLAASRQRLVIFGMIKYRDSLGGPAAPIRETWFSYFFDPSPRRLVMCGQPGANKHT